MTKDEKDILASLAASMAALAEAQVKSNTQIAEALAELKVSSKRKHAGTDAETKQAVENANKDIIFHDFDENITLKWNGEPVVITPGPNEVPSMYVSIYNHWLEDTAFAKSNAKLMQNPEYLAKQLARAALDEGLEVDNA